MKPEIYLISLGCPRNLVDSEVLAGLLKEKGFKIIDSHKKNSVVIVNTCGFIEDAKNESIDMILELADLRKKGDALSLIVTGCLSQRYYKYLIKEIPAIDGVFGCGTFWKIPEYIDGILSGKKPIVIEKTPSFLYDHSMPRLLITPRHSAYVKIQEGCMNFCSYCVIPKIRGSYRSRDFNSILEEIRFFRKNGSKEINIIGQDTTLYGVDRHGKREFSSLLEQSSKIMESLWIRILYTHPAHYDKKLIDVIKKEEAICKYLDLPIQHISDKILKRMNRRVTKKGIISLIKRLRKEIPALALRTSLIVGFPGENDKDFRELEEFIKDIKFERMGVFIFSREEGTKAFSYPGEVSKKAKDERFRRIMEAQRIISEEKNRGYLGRTLKVLIDEADVSAPDHYIGRTEYDAPEVDGTVYVNSKKPLKAGDFVNVKIEDALEYDLVGTVA